MPQNTTKKTAKTPTTKKTATPAKTPAKKAAAKAASNARDRAADGKLAPTTSKIENGADAPASAGAEVAVETTHFRPQVSGDAPRAEVDEYTAELYELQAAERDAISIENEEGDAIGLISDIAPSTATATAPVEVPAEVSAESAYADAPDHALDEVALSVNDAPVETPFEGVDPVVTDVLITTGPNAPVVSVGDVISEKASGVDYEVVSADPVEGGGQTIIAVPKADIPAVSEDPVANAIVNEAIDEVEGIATEVPAPLYARVLAALARLWNYTGPAGSLHDGIYVVRIATILVALLLGIGLAFAFFA